MTMKSPNTLQAILRIIIIIALIEFSIMLAFDYYSFQASIYLKAAADIALLVLFSTPLILFFVVLPFVRDRNKALVRLSQLAETDPLTQLSNRRLLERQLQLFMASSVRHRFYGAVLLLDLDKFKAVNDAYGHEVGDKVLIEVARRLKSRVRLDEVVGRLGGDEFIFLLNNLNAKKEIAKNDALHVAEQLIILLSMPIFVDKLELSISGCIGVSIFGFEETQSEIVVNQADVAMSEAKKLGSGQVVVYSEKTH